MPDSASDSTETRRLLDQVRAGDRPALNKLFTRHRAYLRQVIELRWDRKLRSRLDPDDVLQETQMEAIQLMDDYLSRRPMPFRLWLRKTAQNRLYALWRQHGAAARRAVGREIALLNRSSQLLAQQLLARGPSPSQQVSGRELAERVRQAIAQLPEADRDLVLMRNFDGLSNQEIGFLLDMEPATVSKRHGRALVRLHKILTEAGLRESEL